MGNIFNNFVTKIKAKRNIINNSNDYEYAFSLEEIDNLQEENNEKIKKLKKNKLGLVKEEVIISDKLNLYKKEDNNYLDLGNDSKDKDDIEESFSKDLEDEIDIKKEVF